MERETGRVEAIPGSVWPLQCPFPVRAQSSASYLGEEAAAPVQKQIGEQTTLHDRRASSCFGIHWFCVGYEKAFI